MRCVGRREAGVRLRTPDGPTRVRGAELATRSAPSESPPRGRSAGGVPEAPTDEGKASRCFPDCPVPSPYGPVAQFGGREPMTRKLCSQKSIPFRLRPLTGTLGPVGAMDSASKQDGLACERVGVCARPPPILKHKMHNKTQTVKRCRNGATRDKIFGTSDRLERSQQAWATRATQILIKNRSDRSSFGSSSMTSRLSSAHLSLLGQFLPCILTRH